MKSRESLFVENKTYIFTFPREKNYLEKNDDHEGEVEMFEGLEDIIHLRTNENWYGGLDPRIKLTTKSEYCEKSKYVKFCCSKTPPL